MSSKWSWIEKHIMYPLVSVSPLPVRSKCILSDSSVLTDEWCKWQPYVWWAEPVLSIATQLHLCCRGVTILLRSVGCTSYASRLSKSLSCGWSLLSSPTKFNFVESVLCLAASGFSPALCSMRRLQWWLLEERLAVLILGVSDERCRWHGLLVNALFCCMEVVVALGWVALVLCSSSFPSWFSWLAMEEDVWKMIERWSTLTGCMSMGLKFSSIFCNDQIIEHDKN